MKSSKQEFIREFSSYKDPIANIFYYKDNVYRYVSEQHFGFFEDLLRNKQISSLMNSNDLINTVLAEIVDSEEIENLYHTTKFFLHDKIPYISYPYEWPFSMFKDSAIFTLKLQKKLINENLSIKDATPFNIQFNGTNPVFIDFCSIEPISTNGVWFAYNQFLQAFLYPLILGVYSHLDINSILLSNIEGISFDKTYKMLKLWPKCKPSLIQYLAIPRILSLMSGKDRKELDSRAMAKSRPINNNQAVQTFMINRLIRLVNKMKIGKYKSNWSDYIQSKSYSSESNKFKESYITDFFRQEKVSSVLDLGANTGEFSMIAERFGCTVISIDNDHDCVDNLYVYSRLHGLKILPLCVDISNPTPSIGWNNQERTSFISRIETDCVFALALVHHLIVTNRQPLSRIVDLFAGFTKRFLIVEYIGKDDSMFQLLIKNRREDYDYYDLEFFKKEFSKKFDILKNDQIPGMDRRIFIMTRRNN